MAQSLTSSGFNVNFEDDPNLGGSFINITDPNNLEGIKIQASVIANETIKTMRAVTIESIRSLDSGAKAVNSSNEECK